MSKYLKITILFLFFTQFFDLVYFQLPYGFLTAFMCCLAALGLFKNLKNLPTFTKPILLYILGIACACYSSKIFRGQSNFFTTFNQSYYYTSILFFFVLHWIKPSIHDLEKFFKHIGTLACILYILQYLIYPIPIFMDAAQHEYFENIRVRMTGSALFTILTLLYVNKYILTKKLSYLMFAVLPLLCIFIIGFRTLAIAIIGCSLLMFLFSEGKFSKKIVVITPVIIGLVIFSQIGIVGNKIEGMIKRQTSGHTFDNKQYARVIEYEYYTERYFSGSTERFFGSGPTIYGTSFFKSEMSYQNKMGIYWSDWGLLGLSWIFGMPAAIILAFLIIKPLFVKLPKELQYIKTSCGVLILTSLTLAEIYRNGNLIVISLLLYAVSSTEQKSTSHKRNGNDII